MFRIACMTVLLSLLSASLCVHADERSSLDLDDVLTRYTKAFNNHDADVLSEFYAEKTDVIHADNIPRNSRKEMRDAFAAFFNENPSVQTAYTDVVRTTLAPETIVESGVWHDTGLAEGNSENGRYTSIFRKVNGNWLTVYERGWKTHDSDSAESNGEDAFRSYINLAVGGTWTTTIEGEEYEASYSWAAGEKFAQLKAKGGPLPFVAMIGVDLETKACTWWFYNEDGSTGKNTFTQVSDDAWLLQGSGIGTKGEIRYRGKLTRMNENTIREEVFEFIANGEVQPSGSFVWKRKR